uniref:Uncharacterized protein n=1 Tax=Anguilla anguilla TaxID=7936 RepID=A0A0E9U8V2_ANGAN
MSQIDSIYFPLKIHILPYAACTR